METYATALLFAIPGFSILLIVEILYGKFRHNQTHHPLDTISSLSSGLTNVIKDSLGVVFIILSYPFFLEHLAVMAIEDTVIVYLVGFVAVDFASYWSHRLSHRVNIFWNRHVIHHSSEEFNLAAALRQSVSDLVGLFPFFLIPAAIMGVPAIVIATIAPIHLFLQFWYHTKHIPKLGILEYIIVTPSQHRVHHAINPEYIDKNLGAIFCVWDRMFGTFQEEMEDIPPVYGVLKPASTWNPIKINYQHLYTLCLDAWHTRNWKDKLIIWFKPTGWRPEDVKAKYSFNTIKDVYNFKKYETAASRALVYYAAYQFGFTLMMMMFMLYSFGDLTNGQLWIYGAMLFLGVYGYTTVMDRDPIGAWIEAARGIVGIGLTLYLGGWFGISTLLPGGDLIIMLYFASTILGGVYFTYMDPETATS